MASSREPANAALAELSVEAVISRSYAHPGGDRRGQRRGGARRVVALGGGRRAVQRVGHLSRRAPARAARRGTARARVFSRNAAFTGSNLVCGATERVRRCGARDGGDAARRSP